MPLFLLIYFLAPKKLRNGILFAGSLIFYGWGEPVYISHLLFSTLVDFIHGKMVGRFLDAGRKRAARMVVASSAIINLSLLFVFKYTDFFIRSMNALTDMELPLLGLALPIGISFYTFQTMSYTIDVYRGEAPVQNNIISFGAYVAMFPQLIRRSHRPLPGHCGGIKLQERISGAFFFRDPYFPDRPWKKSASGQSNRSSLDRDYRYCFR